MSPRFLALLVPLVPSVAFATKAALVQYDADRFFGDAHHNLAELTRWAREGVAAGAELVVLPEGGVFGYATARETWCRPGLSSFQGRDCRDVSEVAQSAQGGWLVDHWRAFARQERAVVIFQTPERGDDGRFYNSLVAVNSEGNTTTYRKRDLYFIDEAYATPGSRGTIIQTSFGPLGLLICADANRGSFFEEYKSRGAKGIVISMNWDQSPHDARRGAAVYFRQLARRSNLPLFVSDASPWDGTALYLPSASTPRVRRGLPEPGVGADGVAVVELP